jgi:formiminoglutamate deiminase
VSWPGERVTPSSFWCELAWLDGAPAPDVLVEHRDGVITSVTPGAPAPPAAHRLAGCVLPGLANAHSHAFHRALRGRTHAGGGTFWTWRDAMYALAARLDPDRYLALATAAFTEMLCAGWTAVGEFHYLPGLSDAVRAAADRVGVRLVLLETLYLAGGPGQALSPAQQRFGHGGFDGWAQRVAAGRAGDGAAVHSVRAVPPDALARVREVVGSRPLHVHLSEQPAENADCRAAYGCSPTRLLADTGVLGPTTTVVHATHVDADDRSTLAGTGTAVCLCPTTEADLADGIGPARELADAGCPLALGSDQHAVVDPFAEARAVEYGERLRSGKRGRFAPAELVSALTVGGHHALGLPGGVLAGGAPCDLVAVRRDSARTAGADPAQLVLAAGAADVHTVVVGGQVLVRDGRHVELGGPGPLLAAAITAAWAQPVPGP